MTGAPSRSRCSPTGRAAPSTPSIAPSIASWTRLPRAPTPTSVRPPPNRARRRLNLQLRHQLPHRRRGAVQRHLLLGGELDLDDLLHPLRPETRRHAKEEIPVAVLAAQVDGARQDHVLVEEDRLDHLDDR